MSFKQHEKEARRVFHDVTYIIRFGTSATLLHIEVQQESNGMRWRNEFTNKCQSPSPLSCPPHTPTPIYRCAQKDLEEMTTKTGNFKTFQTFVKMLDSALDKTNKSVFIDLLTYNDLEVLKARKSSKDGSFRFMSHPSSQPFQKTKIKGKPTPTNLNPSQRSKNKRYLILTYHVAFDRVHYPLALKYVDENRTNATSLITSTRTSLSTTNAHSPTNSNLMNPSLPTRNIYTSLSSHRLPTTQPVLYPSLLPPPSSLLPPPSLPLSPSLSLSSLLNNKTLVKKRPQNPILCTIWLPPTIKRHLYPKMRNWKNFFPKL